MKSLGFVVSLLKVASAIAPRIQPYEVRPVVPNETTFQHRIYNGMEAGEGQFPFMILTVMNLGKQISKCSSSLVSPDWVILAAHCLAHPGLRPKDILLLGQKADLWEYMNERTPENKDKKDWGVQERYAAEFFKHPRFSPRTLQHDVALIRAKAVFHLGAVQTIPISLEKMRTPKRCTILGWGLVRRNVDNLNLNYVEGKIVSTTSIGCNYVKQGAFICLEKDNRGICQGDSGSPLVCEGKVWGVASHYTSDADKPVCGNSLEEYYTEIYEDLDWIRNVYGGGSVAGTSLKTVLLCLASLWLSAGR